MSYNCDDCGQFVGYKDVDQYTDFGSAADLEPPDPIIICGGCAGKREEKIVNTIKRPNRLQLPWQPGRFHYRAVARLGMVLASPQGAAWCEAFWPENVPADYELHENPVCDGRLLLSGEPCDE